jgi:hypothetical protein
MNRAQSVHIQTLRHTNVVIRASPAGNDQRSGVLGLSECIEPAIELVFIDLARGESPGEDGAQASHRGDGAASADMVREEACVVDDPLDRKTPEQDRPEHDEQPAPPVNTTAAASPHHLPTSSSASTVPRPRRVD